MSILCLGINFALKVILKTIEQYAQQVTTAV